MGNIFRLWILSLVSLGLFSCANIKDWDKYEKYQAEKGFNRADYEKRLLEEKMSQVKDRGSSKEESLYEKEVKNTMVKMLKEPPTPVKVPDMILRVLILPYVGEGGSLNAMKYVFLKVEEGKWVMGDYLIEEKKGIRLLTPLEAKENEGE